MYPFPGMGCVRGCCGMELGNILDIVVWFRLLDGAGRCFFLSVGPFTPRDVTRVTEDTRATSFHKIHSYWEDGSPRGSCRKPRAMWRGYGEVPMGRWTGLWRRGSVVALTFVFLLRWTPECTGGLGCQVVVDKELDEVWSWLKVWESRLKTRLKFWWLESRSPIATGMGRCGSSEPVMHLDIIRSGSEAIVVHCRIFIRSL